MAVAPTFVKDMATLKARLRMTGAANTDTLTMVDDAVREARVGFIRRLGSNRVTTIAGYTRSDAPTTAHELLRDVAESTEVTWVRYLLFQTLPTLFLDASAISQEAWNAETLSRQYDREKGKELARMEGVIADGLAYLGGNVEEVDRVRAASIEPDTTPPRPFATVFDPETEVTGV